MASSFPIAQPIVQLAAAKHLLSADATQRANIASLAFQSSAVSNGCNFIPSAQGYSPYLWSADQKFSSNFNRAAPDSFGSPSTQLGSASGAAVTASLPINPLAMLPAGVGIGPFVSHDPHMVASLHDVTHAHAIHTTTVDKKLGHALSSARVLSSTSSGNIGTSPIAFSQWPANDACTPNGVQSSVHPYQPAHSGVVGVPVNSTTPTTPSSVLPACPIAALPSHGQALTTTGTPAPVTLPLSCSPTRWYPHPTGEGPVFASPPDERQPSQTELEEFAKKFKLKRIRLGYTQQDVGTELGSLYGNIFSQTTICRFEAQQLSYRNMCKLHSILRRWVEDVETNSTQQQRPGDGKVPLKRRKKRTSIDASVRSRLESFFSSQPKPNAKEIAEYSNVLGFDKEVIRVWFCNRRQKEKRLTPNVSESNGVLTPASETSVALCSGSIADNNVIRPHMGSANTELDKSLHSGEDLSYLQGVTLPVGPCT